MRLNEEALHQELIRTVSDLIGFRSVADNRDELHETAAFVEAYFRNSPVQIKKHNFNGFPALVITTRDTVKPHIFLQGHLDVVEGAPEQFVPHIEGNKLFGRGSVDMKGFDAVAMRLIKEFAETDSGVNLGLMLTFDEEIGGENGAKKLAEMGYAADIIINGDGGYNHAVIFAEKGILKFRMRVESFPGRHPYPWKGENAFDVLIRNYRKVIAMFPDQWKATEKDNWYSTYSVYDVHVENEKFSPPHCAELKMNIYFTEEMSVAELLEKIKENTSDVIIEQISGSERVYLNPRDPFVLQMQRIMQKQFEREIEIRSENGSSDARYFTHLRVPIIIVKMVGEDHHGPQEHLHIPSLLPMYKSLREFVFSQTVPTEKPEKEVSVDEYHA